MKKGLMYFPAWIKILIAIGENPDSSPSDMYRITGIWHGHLYKIVSRLEEEGLINKYVKDKRSYKLSLSESGNKIYNALWRYDL